MSFFDDALKGAVPGGDLATPIAIAAGALLLHHFLGRRLHARPRARRRRPLPPRRRVRRADFSAAADCSGASPTSSAS